MLTCLKCNAQNNDSARFCENCGAPLTAQLYGEQTPQMQYHSAPQTQPSQSQQTAHGQQYGQQSAYGQQYAQQEAYRQPYGQQSAYGQQYNQQAPYGQQTAYQQSYGQAFYGAKPQQKKKHIAVIVAIIAAVVVLLCGAGYAAFRALTRANAAIDPVINAITSPDEGMPDPDAPPATPAQTAGDYAIEIEKSATNYTLENENGKTETVFETGFEIISAPDASRALQKSLEIYNETVAWDKQSVAIDNGQDIFSDYVGNDYFITWADQRSITVDRADADVFSFVEANETYYGGAHGYIAYVGYNFDAQTGEEIALDDAVTDRRAFANAIEEQMRKDDSFADVMENYKEAFGDSFADYLLEWYLSDEYVSLFPWTISENGVHVWFEDYMLGAYAYGARDIILDCEDYPDAFRDVSFLKKKDAATDLEARIERTTFMEEEIDLRELCEKEGGRTLFDFSTLEGAYFSTDGDLLTIDRWGYYEYTPESDAADDVKYVGYLAATTDGFEMYEIYNTKEDWMDDYDPDAADLTDGKMSVVEDGAIHMQTKDGEIDFYYSEEQSNFWLYSGYGEDDFPLDLDGE